MESSSKRFGLLDSTFINVGSKLAAGIFIVSGVAIARAGVGTIPSIILAAIVAAICAASYYELSEFVGKEGGIYEYVREGFSNNTGFIAGWLWATSMLATTAAAAVSIGTYIDSALGKGFLLPVVGSLVIIFVMVASIARVRLTSRFMIALSAITLISVLVFVVAGARYIGGLSNYPSLALGSIVSNSTTLGNTLFGAGVMFLAFAGFLRITSVRSQVDGAKDGKSVRKSMFLSMLIYALVYLVFSFVVVGMLSVSRSSLSTYPDILEANLLHDKTLLAFFVGVGVLALLGLITACVGGAARVFYAMARDNELPPILRRVDGETKPYVAIAFGSIASIILTFVAPFNALIDTASATMLLAFAIVNLTALNVNIKESKSEKALNTLISKGFFSVIPILGIIGTLALLYYLNASRFGLSVAFGIMLVGSIYYTYGKVLILPKGATTTVKESPERSEVREFVG